MNTFKKIAIATGVASSLIGMPAGAGYAEHRAIQAKVALEREDVDTADKAIGEGRQGLLLFAGSTAIAIGSIIALKKTGGDSDETLATLPIIPS